MASKDVLDQIRDLQSFIDDFAADAGSSPMISPEEKTKLVFATPLTKDSILHKPDEKTEVEEAAKIIEEKTADDEENIAEVEVKEEKTLVESPVESPIEPPLSILSYDLNLSDDFSSLLTQFKEIKVSNIDVKSLQRQNVYIEDDKEKIQVDTPSSNIDNYTATTPKFSDSFFLNDQLLNTGSSSKSHSRRTSISSKKSQRSARSARRQNEKKLQQQHKQQLQQQQHQPQKYVERSYDEMMRIPDIYERLAFYEKTLDLCLKAESPIASWYNSNREKGKPAAMLEGYVPPVRSSSPEMSLSENGLGNMSSTFSGSISTFLKKAGNSQSMARRQITENMSLLVSSSAHNTPHTTPHTTPHNTPHTPTGYSSGSGLFGKSLSKLSLSRSTQIPRYDHQLQQIKTPITTRLTPMHNNRVSSPTSRKKKTTVNTLNKTLSPLCMNYGNREMNSSPNLIRTPRSSSSTPSSFGSSTVINNHGEFANQSSGLNYLINILPQIDAHILQNALDEAKGDPMVAISIAVSQSKLSVANSQPMQTQKKISSKHYNKKVK